MVLGYGRRSTVRHFRNFSPHPTSSPKHLDLGAIVFGAIRDGILRLPGVIGDKVSDERLRVLKSATSELRGDATTHGFPSLRFVAGRAVLSLH